MLSSYHLFYSAWITLCFLSSCLGRKCSLLHAYKGLPLVLGHPLLLPLSQLFPSLISSLLVITTVFLSYICSFRIVSYVAISIKALLDPSTQSALVDGCKSVFRTVVQISRCECYSSPDFQI